MESPLATGPEGENSISKALFLGKVESFVERFDTSSDSENFDRGSKLSAVLHLLSRGTVEIVPPLTDEEDRYVHEQVEGKLYIVMPRLAQEADELRTQTIEKGRELTL